ncbi:MAG: exonuclease domain-containing protein [Pseudomonadota bacterium]
MRRLLDAPLPRGRDTVSEHELVCLDMETNGLDAASVDMLSVGWVIVRNGQVDVSSATRRLLNANSEVGDSATVHGITDTDLTRGISLTDALDQVVTALTGRILVVHHAGLDKAVLDRLCRVHYGCRLIVPVIDTLALAIARSHRQHHLASRQSLRLPDLREHYGLPYYAAHDCLVDALATAELLLAMLAHHGEGAATRMSTLMTA